MPAADNDIFHEDQPSKRILPLTILGRITQAIRTQNWFAVVLELLIVVFGIVIGFQVTEWGDARAARAEELALLRSLKVEYEEVASDLELQVAKHQRVEGDLTAILDALRTAEQASETAASIADMTLVWALVATTTQFSQGVLDGILRSGRLQLIQNAELRTALSEWAGVMADVVEDEVASRDITVQQLEPAMAKLMDIRAFRTYQHFYPDVPQSVLNGRSRVPVDIELMGIFSTRRFWQRHLIQEFDGPRQEAQRILRLIEQELQEKTR